MNLLDLIQTNVTLRKVARTNGGEYAGPCPFCGGRDRFRVWPEEDGGRFWCRGCSKAGDAIQFLRDFRRLSFLEACAELEIDPDLKREHRAAAEEFTPRENGIPGELWQQRAGEFLAMAKGNLQRNPVALAWLWGRGLKNETIERAGLGWNSMDTYENREAWGLPPEMNERGKAKKLWLPTGLVIPLQVNGAVIRLRIRRQDPGDRSRYVIASGSYTGPMTWGPDKETLCIVESELDGLLIDQEAGDLAGVVALGNAQARPDTETDKALRQAASILVSLDFDEAGAKASWGFWLSAYSKARRWPTPLGKDPSEAFQKGLSIRAWVEAGLTVKPSSLYGEKHTEATIKPFPREWLQSFDEDQLERLALMTIDGRLSDNEAVRLLN